MEEPVPLARPFSNAGQTVLSCREEGVPLCRWSSEPRGLADRSISAMPLPGPEAAGTLADTENRRALPSPAGAGVGPSYSRAFSQDAEARQPQEMAGSGESFPPARMAAGGGSYTDWLRARKVNA